MSVITTHRDGDVLVVVSDNPPVNALSAGVRQGLVDAVAEAEADDAIRAVVIRADGRTFFAGADITEFGGSGPKAVGLVEAIDRIEAMRKPVVAAIHGTALGGGLEVALGCHYRVAVPSAKLGLPEVKLGLIPGAGGTQRLPRVIGAEASLPLIVGGDPVSATNAEKMGLVDRIVGESSLEADAIAFAREMIGRPIPVSSTRTDKTANTPASLFDQFRKANARKLRGFDAPEAGIKAVEAAVSLPFAEGMKRELELFAPLMTSVQSQALRHMFFAERAAAKIDDVPRDTPILPIKKVGVIGAGTMGGGIAMNFLSAGFDVTLVERDQAPLDRGIGIIRKNYENTAAKGRITAAHVETAMGHLTGSLDFSDLAGCDLVIEAVFENMDIKKDVFARLDAICKPEAILATNTSYLDVNEIAQATKRPESVIGLHFFSPANVMRMLEVVRGAKTGAPVLATSMKLAKTIGKTPVVAGVCHGFIGNRMLAARQNQSESLLREGALPAQVDKVLLDFGFPMGPFQMADLAGLDIGWIAAESNGETVKDALCERGRLGQKTGKGYYDYDEKRRGTPSDEVTALIRDRVAASGSAPRQISDEEILERLLYPMINEAALILEEGIAQRASDIDVVYVNGYGWPSYTGGPMFWAGTVGLDKIVAGLKKHADKWPDLTISKLLQDKAAKGEGFI